MENVEKGGKQRRKCGKSEWNYVKSEREEKWIRGNTSKFRRRDMILVDADACPVIGLIEQIAEKYKIPCILFCDTNHVLSSDYSEVRVIGAGADAVDFALVGACSRGDIVVSQDYGVAAMVLGKGASCIHQNGREYTNENIDRLLMERHMAKKARRAKSKHHLKGPARRTEEDDRRFAEAFERLVRKWRK